MSISRLLQIMAALRTPGTGCPWDLEQDFASIVPYTIEEAYEVADAIARGDLSDLREELGDLLLQVVFHARMAEEQGVFDFAGVVNGLTEKWCGAIPMCSGMHRVSRRMRSGSCGNASRPRNSHKSPNAQVPMLPRARLLASLSLFPPSPARSSCRPKPAKSALTGKTRWRCSPKFARL